MAYVFDGRAFGQVLVETERLAEQSRDHERRLARLVQQLEGPSKPMNGDLLVEIRHLCVNTREQRLQLDEYYVRNWSLWMDIAVLIRTINSVVRGQGAY